MKKMKTNKQQLVILMLLVISTTLTMVTVITPFIMEQKAQASILGQIGAQGYDDGRAQARSDFAQGIRHAVCPRESDFAYCSYWTMGYNDAWDGLKTANEP
jgi:hypothetical protein